MRWQPPTSIRMAAQTSRRLCRELRLLDSWSQYISATETERLARRLRSISARNLRKWPREISTTTAIRISWWLVFKGLLRCSWVTAAEDLTLVLPPAPELLAILP